MKKICLLTLLALGLTGLASAANDTWVTPQPVKSYLYANIPMSSNEFFDLSTAYTENGDDIALNTAATAYGVQKIVVLGKDLANDAELNNLFFGYKDNAWETATRTGADSKTTTFPLQNLLGNTAFSFMETTVTDMILSAAGGVYFTDAAGGNVEMTLPDPLAGLKAQAVQYAARGFIAKYTNGVDGSGNFTLSVANVPITKMAGKPVCHIALCQDNVSGLKYMLVQYNLSVNTHALVYQIKIGDDGRVEYRIGQQGKTTDNDDYYTFRIDLKRNTDTLSFGGQSAYSISPILTEGDKTAWVCNNAQSLEKRRLSIYPKGGIITGASAYTSINATMVLSAKSQEAAGNASSLLVIVSPQTSVNPGFENKAYQVGDYVENAQDFRKAGFPVVYSGKPTDLTDISFTASGLTPNETYYLYAYLCKQDGTNYRYSSEVFVSSDGMKTSPMETPTDITVGEPVDGNIPLTFSASSFKLLVLKSDSTQSNNPKGVLAAGDRDGKVVAVLDKNATTCNIPMAPGEMTYIQIYAIDDNATPGYSSNFSLLPLYRQADRLPLGYTFSIKDYIANQPENAMPILPPGLSTSTAFGEDHRLEAFFVDAPIHFEQGTKLLMSHIYGTEWPNVILPAFTGVMKIQATFNVKFYKFAMTGHSEAAPVASDQVRIEYRLNGGTWQTVGQFSGDKMPEAVNGNYPLSVSISCRPVDVVELRYSFHGDNNTEHAIVSYEFVDASDCEMPTNLKVESEQMTDKAVTLTWRDNNNPVTGNYLVSYQKYVAPTVEEDGNPIASDGDEDEDWETLTVNTTTAKLRNLAGGITYTVQVQAVCTSGESIPSSPVQVTAPAGLPYAEPLTFAEMNRLTQDYTIKPNVSVYKGEPGEGWEPADYLQSIEETPDSWNARYSETAVSMEDPDALAVSTAQDEAILVTPAIYIHPYITPLPKTLTFRVNTYGYNEDMDFENGVDLLNENLRLYVLVSNSGAFTWKDTVASYGHNALKTEASSEDIADRGKDFSIKLDKFEGLVRIAFFFHNPNSLIPSDEKLPMFLEILNISLNYDGEVPCFPVDNLKTIDADETEITLTWEGEGEEYGITYYPTDDKSKAVTKYQDATEADLQTLKLTNLLGNTEYTAEVISYCTKGDRETGSIAMRIEFRTLRKLYGVKVNITPKDAGTVRGAGSYFDGINVTLTARAQEGYKFVVWMDGETELGTDTTYKFRMPAQDVEYTAEFAPLEKYGITVIVSPLKGGTVKGTGKYTEGDEVTLTALPFPGYQFIAWKDGETELTAKTTYTFKMPGENITYTALFEEATANENTVSAHFSVGSDNGRIMVRNLNGLLVKHVEVFGLNGTRINRFATDSREDLTLPVDAAHTLVFVRLHTENGVAVYKVYVH